MFVVNGGMTTCVGSGLDPSCAAFRCRLSGFAALPYEDLRNERVIGAPVQQVASERKGGERLLDLAVPALQECLASIDGVESRRVALLLASGSGRSGSEGAKSAELLKKLCVTLSQEFSLRSAALSGGAFQAISALTQARSLLVRREVDFCIVGGVDSMLDGSQLRTLERQRRLKRDNDPDGLIPGEAACFLLCAPAPVAGQPCLRISGLGAASERDRPRAEPLAIAMRQAITEAGRRSSEISVLITDLTGERDLGVEYALALTRVFVEPQDGLQAWHLAMSVGTIGAAFFPTAVAWWLAACRRGYAPGAHAMCTVLSEAGWRGASVLSVQA
jgi:3-oxoacyl-[acyl-carrier-protein] synthase-1